MKDFRIILTKICPSATYPNRIFKMRQEFVCRWADRGYDVDVFRSTELIDDINTRKSSVFSYQNISGNAIEVWVNNARSVYETGNGYFSVKRVAIQ